MFRGVFITGTDTNVGKTVVASAVMHRYRNIAPVCYWKPIQTGIEVDDDTATVRRLGSCHAGEILARGVRLPHPVSPHLAARLSNTSIHIDDVSQILEKERGSHAWVIEGAGGVLVPINDYNLMIDLMIYLAVGVVVVARSGLGTINHTLLTVQALRARGLPVGGVVMVGDSNPDNKEAIERFGNVQVVGEMPMFSDLSSESIREWATQHLDPDNHLTRYLE